VHGLVAQGGELGELGIVRGTTSALVASMSSATFLKKRHTAESIGSRRWNAPEVVDT
jgi:hypothetical protein